MATVKLDDIVSSLLNEMDSSIHTRRRLYDIGIDGIREMNINVKGRIKTTTLIVDPNKTASYPLDYINYRKLGVHNDDGEIATFEINKNLSRFNAHNPSRNIGKPGTPERVNQFNPDDETRCFVFDPDFAIAEVILEYLSNDILDSESDFSIDERLEELMKAWIYYKSIQRLKGFAQYEKNDARAILNKERTKAKAMLNPFRIHEANTVIRKGVKLVLKH
jgi:hypothetical protein